MYRCPICGDFYDDKDWCSHCQIPMEEEINSAILTRDEQDEADHYYAKLYEEYISDCIKNEENNV